MRTPKTCQYCDTKAIGYERVYGTPDDIKVCSECAHVNATVNLYDGGTYCKRSTNQEPTVTLFEKEPSLTELQAIVGGYIEGIALHDGRMMWVNEDGLLKMLPYNVEASDMTGRPIVGNVAIVGEVK